MTKYITLMSSLPPLGKLFETTQTPISRLKLESRLKLLEPKDRELLNRIANLIAWSEQPMARTDTQFVEEAKHFFAVISNRTLKEVVEHRLNLRTIVAALRRRHRGESEPPVGQIWGVGNWVSFIEKHWTEPGFHLEAIFPWVVEANRLLTANDLVGIERLQFEVNWQMLDRLGTGHYFDFEAVIIYLMRWSLVDRWTRYNGDVAVERFRKLVDSGIEKFTDVFASHT
jgi:hypothetical protein